MSDLRSRNVNRGPRTTASELAVLARECGLDGAGAAPADPVPVDVGQVTRLVQGAPRDLGYLVARLRERLDPGLLLPGVRSVVVAFVSYAGTLPGVQAMPSGRGFVSRFAWGRDYHRVVGERMERFAGAISARWGVRARWYVDTGPVFEKAYAVAAGLGFVGRNSLVIHPEYGSFIFLGSILTDLVVSPGARRMADGCGRCRACVNVCPTRALERPYVLDPGRCLAHRTVSDRSLPDPALAPRLAGNLFGCDLCQDVCPWNRRAVRPVRPEFSPLPGVYMPRLRDILDMDEARFVEVFGQTPVRRRTLPLLKATARLLVEGWGTGCARDYFRTQELSSQR